MTTSDESRKITKKELRSLFWRSCSMDFSWNYERQCSLGYAFSMAPIIRKLYDKKEDRAKALKRHLEFFNITSWVSTLPLGISAAMEEGNAGAEMEKDGFDTASINSVKTALMGPLSAIGDSFFWGTVRLIATGIGTSLAIQGNILGPILFLLVFNTPAWIARYTLTGIGYNAGTGFLKQMEKEGTISDLTYGAAVLGLVVIGAMTASMINVGTPVMIGSGEGAYALQRMFDDIMPRFLPLAAFGIVYKLLGKKVNPLVILVGVFVVSILGAMLGILQ